MTSDGLCTQLDVISLKYMSSLWLAQNNIHVTQVVEHIHSPL